MIKRSFILATLLVLAGILNAQTTFHTVNQSYIGTSSVPGTLGYEINQSLSNPGNHVIELDLPSPGIIYVDNVIPAIVIGSGSGKSITIRKKPTAAVAQTIKMSNSTPFPYTIGVVTKFFDVQNNGTGNVVFDNIVFQDFDHLQTGNKTVSPIYINSGRNVSVLNSTFKTCNCAIVFCFTQNCLVDGCLFDFSGGNPSEQSYGIKEDYQAASGAGFKVNISNNIFNVTNSTAYSYTGIFISPYTQVNGNNTAYSCNSEYNILNNISNFPGMFLRSDVYFPSSSYGSWFDVPDVTYKLRIDGNTLNTSNIIICFPMKHFIIDNNIFNNNLAVCNQCIMFGYLGNAGYGTTNFKDYGFDMIGPNTLGLPLKNNNNQFNALNGSQYSFNNIIIRQLDKVKYNFVGINFGVRTRINAVDNKFVTIRECLLFNDFVIVNPISNIESPINLRFVASNSGPYSNASGPCVGASGPISTYGNNLIASPQPIKAIVKPNAVKFVFTLTGNEITTANAPFVVEFFKSSDYGDLQAFIGNYVISTPSASEYTVTLPIPPGVNVLPGDRFAFTATSLSATGPVKGTSEVSYIKSCNECISDFAPEPGKYYVLSAWILINSVVSGNINLDFYSSPTTLISNSSVNFAPVATTPIVDGWIKIGGEFQIPSATTIMKIALNNNTPGMFPYEVYFDDIRIHPKDAMEKSYVYDPETMRLMAELDERNFATLYEYDEEGKLIRVKKETERGVMTIKESRNSKPVKQ